MKYGGVSLQGSYHAENQDAYMVCELDGNYILAVSDGLGSRPHSAVGSAALCKVVYETLVECSCQIVSAEDFLRDVHERWKIAVAEKELDISDSNATALICIVTAEDIHAYRLGDGFLAVAADGERAVLFDEKEDGFANLTDCLDSDFILASWEYRHLCMRTFEGVIAGTDGLDLHMNATNLTDFLYDFCAEYQAETAEEIEADIRMWLPRLGGVDDTTLAFLLPS